jgi:WD40-like Beta Propeller Repeat
LLALILVGCKTLQVRIAPEPPDAKVVVRDPSKSDKPVLAPAEGSKDRFSFNFPDNSKTYEVQVQRDGFEPATETLTLSRAEALPKTGETATFAIILKKKVPVQISVEPEDAAATLKSSDGQTVKEFKGTLDTELMFWKGGPSYTVSATREEYVDASRSITWEEAEAAAATDAGAKKFKLALDGRDFSNQSQAIIVYDRQKGFVATLRNVRAYRSTEEATGTTPSRIHDLPEGLGIRGLAISPDGTRLAFGEATAQDLDEVKKQSEKADTVPIKSCQIKAINIGRAGLINLTSPGFVDVDPAYSADEGRNIMFVSDRYKQPNILQIRATEKSGMQTVFRDTRGWAAMRPSMGADGTIVFSLYPTYDEAKQVTPPPQIWTTGGPNNFDTYITEGDDPQISPDGTKIAYIGKDRNLWVINRDGTNATQLTTQADDIVTKLMAKVSANEKAFYDKHTLLLRPYAKPTWTPDSKHILFVSMEALDTTGRPNEDIWAIKADGTGARQLTANGSVDTYPVMSPDMQKIYFVSNRGNRWAIFQMPAPSALSGGN